MGEQDAAPDWLATLVVLAKIVGLTAVVFSPRVRVFFFRLVSTCRDALRAGVARLTAPPVPDLVLPRQVPVASEATSEPAFLADAALDPERQHDLVVTFADGRRMIVECKVFADAGTPLPPAGGGAGGDCQSRAGSGGGGRSGSDARSFTAPVPPHSGDAALTAWMRSPSVNTVDSAGSESAAVLVARLLPTPGSSRVAVCHARSWRRDRQHLGILGDRA